MELLNKTSLDVLGQGKDTELVQQQKQEYKHLGQYWRNKSLQLYAYSCQNDTLEKVDIVLSKTIHAVPFDGKLIAVDMEFEKAVVDSRLIFFEALNDRTANERLNKWKQGKVKELCNLREVGNSTIKLI